MPPRSSAALIPVAAFLTLAAAPLVAQQRRGAIAFEYAPTLTPQQIRWYSRFDVLVTHDPLPPPQVAALKAAGTRLVLYEWSVAFYASAVKSGSWQSQLRRTRQGLLNRKPLRGGSGSQNADAYYYDPASRHHSARALSLVQRLRKIGYDGLFFDTTTEQSVHPEALKEFRKRHPGEEYDRSFAEFLRELRRISDKGLIITNQGFRRAEHYLSHADWDVTESLITAPRNGRFEMREWRSPIDPWNSIDHLMRALILPMQSRYPHVRFAHLNYLPDPDPATIARIAAIAQLYGSEWFVTHPEVHPGHHYPSDAYFFDAGPAQSELTATEQGASRWFEHALIAVNASREPMVIPNPGGEELIDLVTGETMRGESIVIRGVDADGIRAVILRRSRR